MVNLPDPSGQAGRAVGERGSVRPRSQWRYYGIRFGRRRDEVKLLGPEPTTLGQLELQALRTVDLMAKHGNRSKGNFALAMDMLRQQYNLNFMIICDLCGNLHQHHDTLRAPER